MGTPHGSAAITTEPIARPQGRAAQRCGTSWTAPRRSSATSRCWRLSCWPGWAHRELGDQRAANQAAERALALAEPNRPVLPFLMTDSRELLKALPRHLSRLEIASELSVSPNTVGTHIRSIYAKLGVRDRSAAVQRAREFRLLAADRTR